MTNIEKNSLAIAACKVCMGVIESTYDAKAGHPGVDMSTGSLGQGISKAVGMAKAAKLMGKDNVRVHCMLGDGEIAEDEVWEAFLFAAHYSLDNFCAIIDLNGL